jgi:hypothetical protein
MSLSIPAFSGHRESEQEVDVDVERTRVSEQLQSREAVAAWAGSGKTLKAYCDETGQSYWSLRRWRLKFGEELGVAIRRRAGARKASATKVMPKAAKLVPIEVSRVKPAVTIEIRLRGERTVVVGTDIESTVLSRLVGAIERAT